MKGLRVETKIIINRPVEEVCYYAVDPLNAKEWYTNIKEAHWVKGTQPQEGGEMAFKAKFLGRELAYTYTIRKWEPPHILIMSTSEGPFPMETTYKWESVNENYTRMTLINRGEPVGFAKWLSPFMASAMLRANKKDLKNLRQILESK